MGVVRKLLAAFVGLLAFFIAKRTLEPVQEVGGYDFIFERAGPFETLVTKHDFPEVRSSSKQTRGSVRAVPARTTPASSHSEATWRANEPVAVVPCSRAKGSFAWRRRRTACSCSAPLRAA